MYVTISVVLLVTGHWSHCDLARLTIVALSLLTEPGEECLAIWVSVMLPRIRDRGRCTSRAIDESKLADDLINSAFGGDWGRRNAGSARPVSTGETATYLGSHGVGGCVRNCECGDEGV